MALADGVLNITVFAQEAPKKEKISVPVLTPKEQEDVPMLQESKEEKGDVAAETVAEDDATVQMENGQGLEYQILAGPAFTIFFTCAGLVNGILADKTNRLC